MNPSIKYFIQAIYLISLVICTATIGQAKAGEKQSLPEQETELAVVQHNMNSLTDTTVVNRKQNKATISQTGTNNRVVVTQRSGSTETGNNVRITGNRLMLKDLPGSMHNADVFFAISNHQLLVSPLSLFRLFIIHPASLVMDSEMPFHFYYQSNNQLLIIHSNNQQLFISSEI